MLKRRPDLAATSHLPSVKSIHQGLKKASTSRNGKPGASMPLSLPIPPATVDVR